MNHNDTFDAEQDPDRTLLIPTPGGRRPAPAPAAVQPPLAAQPAPRTATTVVVNGKGLNPLVRAANPLLDLVVPLRLMTSAPDMESLRQRLIQAIQAFEGQARTSQIPAETVAASRYALCTLVDETISSTPWGAGVWNSRSLLVTFHNEAWGGEKFFLILQRLSQDPRTHIDVLELLYLCMALGLEGRYRVLDRGLDQLTTLRERLLRLIQQQRGAQEQDLSLRWRGAETVQPSMLRLVPWWVLAAVAAVLLLTLQMTYSWLLNRASDPVFAQMGAIRVASPLRAPAAPTPAPVRLSGFLAAEVAQGLVSVKDSADRSVVTLRGDGVFASGSAEVSSNFDDLLARIGDALKTVPGDVVVVGHTDNLRPSLSSRFASNFDLSTARAKTVARLLAERTGAPERYRSEGRGETEPLVANDSAANRARNRRVDITVLIPAQGQ
ncbi:DotU family type VI secretion system protein [Pseudomonas gingeri]|uniref:DotU family type VI secretion system protein n=1 Tax=Pseudomonas gingeri TaxID=117681 RepID=A0A7Y7Y9L5_9PSED|nr:DotU family type VI secretion system protein [Pseudomonas gingeri]NWA12307.1 DotU family type VI secretion system protein [Pseudomonas gingeri]NWA57287.1 DotU family type VI secretion system protein [Pseudomonas gingeri]NWA93630.1 DotU family type VI secretion system protein [Pseudomonas gingeri]NWB03102.1 DotU family type VI secretion system protein [Pseudomonas gingeri]